MAVYPEEGTPQAPEEHEAHNIPTATEHYAGDVVNFPSVMSNPNLSKSNPNATLNRAIGRDNVIPLKPVGK